MYCNVQLVIFFCHFLELIFTELQVLYGCVMVIYSIKLLFILNLQTPKSRWVGLRLWVTGHCHTTAATRCPPADRQAEPGERCGLADYDPQHFNEGRRKMGRRVHSQVVWPLVLFDVTFNRDSVYCAYSPTG